MTGRVVGRRVVGVADHVPVADPIPVGAGRRIDGAGRRNDRISVVRRVDPAGAVGPGAVHDSTLPVGDRVVADPSGTHLP